MQSRENKPMTKLRNSFLLAVAAAALTGCGKSGDARKTEAVRCYGFMTAMLGSMQDPDHPSEFIQAYGRVAKDHFKGQEAKLSAVAALGEQLSGQMEATKSAAAQQDGSQDFLKFQKVNDADGAVEYVDDCVANHDKLLAAAR